MTHYNPYPRKQKKERRKFSNQRESTKKRKEIPNQRVGESKKKRKEIPNQRMGERKKKKRKERKFLIKELEEMCRKVF